MKKFLPYILIVVLLAEFFSAARNTEAAGACRWKIEERILTDVTHRKDEVVNPPVSEPRCRDNPTTYYWDPAYITPTPPTPTTPTKTTDPNYKLLAPLPCETDQSKPGYLPGCTTDKGLETFNPTGDGNLGRYLNLMLRIFIGLCAVLAVVMIVVGGLEYMSSELISGKEAGKDRIIHALLGLLLALGAIPLLNTINPNLLSSDLKIDTAMVEVDMSADVPQTYDPISKKYLNGTIFGAKWDDSVAPIATSSEPWWQYISINTSQCTTVGQRNCTSTRGLDLGNLKTIQWGCNCMLQITGGTEDWKR